MHARLREGLGAAGLDPAEAEAVLRAHDEAGAHRAALLPPDEDDPRWLHPGRNLVILLGDGTVRDPETLALATALDQGSPGLMPPQGMAGADLRGIPLLEGGVGARASEEEEGAWTEGLVLLPTPLLQVVLADLLDHLRHLHLAPPSPERVRTVLRAEALLLPLAIRLGGVWERRFRWWCSRVGRGLAASPDFNSS